MRQGAYRPSGPVLTLALTRLIGAVASYMTLPFIAVRLVDAGAGFAAAGLVVAIGPATAALAGVFGGMLADTVGRRRALFLGNLGSMLAMAGFALSHGVLAYALLGALNGASRAVAGPASSSVVADVTSPQERAEAYAYGRVAMNIGAALGPFIGALLVISHPAPLFLSAAAADLAIVGILALMVPETGRRRREVSHREAARMMAGDGALWLYMAGGTIQWGTYQIIETIFPAFLKGAVPGGLTLYAIMTAVNTVMVATLQLPYNRALRQRPKGTIFMTGLLLFAAAYVGYAFLRLPAALIATMVVFTLGEMTVFAVMPAFESELGVEAIRGRMFGVLSLKRLGAALWPLGAGILLAWGGPRPAFLAVAGAAVAAGIMLRQAVRMRDARAAKHPEGASA